MAFIWSMKVLIEAFISFAKPRAGPVVDPAELELVLVEPWLRLVQTIDVEHVAADGGRLPRDQGLDRRSVAVEPHDIGACRRVLGDLGILRAGAGDGYRELAHIGVGLDLGCLGRSQHDDIGDIGLAELHRLGAIRKHRHGREQQIDPSRRQRGNTVGDFKRHEFDGNAKKLAVQLANVRVEAFLLAAGIDETPGRVVALNSDHDLALGLDFGRRDRKRRSGHYRGRGQ